MKKTIKKKLNLNYINVAKNTYAIGKYDMPCVNANINIYPDYLALFSEIKDYHKTLNTCVCFYQYDDLFDGIKGLYNAIYYDDKSLLKRFKERFKDVKFFIAPDYSQIGDVHMAENLYRQFKSRIVSIWLTMETNGIVIPNITYSNEDSFEYMLDGFEESNIVAFSTKGSMRNPHDKDLLLKAIKYTVDHMSLKTIIVYSVGTDDTKIYELFDYAISRGINILVPDNTLKLRNVERMAARNGKI